jgi:phosphohistidine phosphatase
MGRQARGTSASVFSRKETTLVEGSGPSQLESNTQEAPLKTVLLLRHAKSSWDEPLLEDFRRPLAPRGRKAATRMGRFMGREGLIPQRVLCSGAVRATETWELLSEGLDRNVPTEIRDDIYHASPMSLLELVRSLPDHEDSVLLVGHNPTFEDLARQLIGSGDPGALRDLASKYPTGALAVLDFRIGRWVELDPGEGDLRAFVRPKALA